MKATQVNRAELKPFCQKEEGRFDLTRPFLIGEHIYATDRKVLVCVPTAGECGEGQSVVVPDVVTFMKRVYPTTEHWSRWDGKLLTGLSGCPKCWDKSEDDPSCDTCNGSGQAVWKAFVRLGRTYVGRGYFDKIGSLRDVEFASETKPDNPIPFRWPGGVGLLMPIKRNSVLENIWRNREAAWVECGSCKGKGRVRA